MLPKPEKPDAKVSHDYLQEDTIFSPNMQAENPQSIIYDDEEDKSLKASKQSNQDLLNDLDAILAHHGNKTNDSYQPSLDSKDNEKNKDIKFKKISLFDDDDLN